MRHKSRVKWSSWVLTIIGACCFVFPPLGSSVAEAGKKTTVSQKRYTASDRFKDRWSNPRADASIGGGLGGNPVPPDSKTPKGK